MAKPVKTTKRSTQKKVVTKTVSPIPNYWEFTKQVFNQLKQTNKLFLRLVGLLAAIVIILTLTSQQSAYIDQVTGIQTVSSEISSGVFAKLLETGVLFLTLISGTLTTTLSESQQLSLSLLYLLTWLIVIWLLRHLLVNKRVSVREGLYSASAPLVSTVLVVFVAALQLIPLAILTAILSAIATTGAVSGVLVVLGVLLIAGMAVVTLYWLVGTLFGAIIVTIPGTYPLAALRSARDIVAGKRVLILKRLLWLGFINLIVYTFVMLPVLFIDTLSGFALSFITIGITITLSMCLFIFSSAYLYLLYRRVIDEYTV